MKAFTANFSDLGPSKTNPSSIWSPAYLSLKLAIERNEDPGVIIQELYAWLNQRGVKPVEVDAILDLEPDAALDALLHKVGGTKGMMKAEGLPKSIKATLQRVVQRLASNYVAKSEQELAQHSKRLANMRKRFSAEGPEKVVDSLLT